MSLINIKPGSVGVSNETDSKGFQWDVYIEIFGWPLEYWILTKVIFI